MAAPPIARLGWAVSCPLHGGVAIQGNDSKRTECAKEICMNTNVSPEDIDSEKWISTMPSPPSVVCESLHRARVFAHWHPDYEITNDQRVIYKPAGDLIIWSSFARLPVIKKILRESGVPRTKFPRTVAGMRPGRRTHLRLRIRYNAAGPEVRSSISLKLKLEQKLKLEHYAQRVGKTLHQAAQALFDQTVKDV
ncbi:MAG TPA: hypothetical protein VJA21_19440 [Verrucomicrobiae bacterium]